MSKNNEVGAINAGQMPPPAITGFAIGQEPDINPQTGMAMPSVPNPPTPPPVAQPQQPVANPAPVARPPTVVPVVAPPIVSKSSSVGQNEPDINPATGASWGATGATPPKGSVVGSPSPTILPTSGLGAPNTAPKPTDIPAPALNFTPTGNVPTDLVALQKLGANAAQVASYMAEYGKSYDLNSWASNGSPQEKAAADYLKSIGYDPTAPMYEFQTNDPTKGTLRIPVTIYDKAKPQDQFAILH